MKGWVLMVPENDLGLRLAIYHEACNHQADAVSLLAQQSQASEEKAEKIDPWHEGASK